MFFKNIEIKKSKYHFLSSYNLIFKQSNISINNNIYYNMKKNESFNIFFILIIYFVPDFK